MYIHKCERYEKIYNLAIVFTVQYTFDDGSRLVRVLYYTDLSF